MFGITPKAYKGTEITSVERANEICEESFGEGWHWFEWHEDQSQRYWYRLKSVPVSNPPGCLPPIFKFRIRAVEG